MKKSISFEPSKEHLFHCALFEFNKGSKAVQSWKNITSIYSTESISERTINRWFSSFKKGEFEYKKKDKKKKKRKYNMSNISEALDDNPFFSVREISSYTEIPKSTIYDYLISLGKVNKFGSNIPHDLSNYQKKIRLEICQKNLNFFNKCSFLNQIITGDEKWIYYKNIGKKDSGLIKEKLQFPPQKRKRWEKKLC